MQAEAAQQSILSWVFNSLGFPYVMLIPLAGILSFLLALFIVLRGRGPLAAAALILVVHVPLFVGFFAAFQGMIASFTIIAMSGTTPKPSELAQGYATAMVAPMMSILMMTPGYLVAVVGAFFRCIAGKVESSDS